MINPFKQVKWNPDARDRRKFSLSLLIGFPCLAGALLLMGKLTTGSWNFPLAVKVGGIGAAAGLVFLTVPALIKPFYLAWYFLACCIGLVIGNLLLVVVFYSILTVISLLLRAMRHTAIRRTPDRRATTYWQEARPSTDLRRYYSQF
jgi:hypothetical protein